MNVIGPTAMKTSLTLNFGAFGGLAPYSYEVLPDGAGGTIDPATGAYTSPAGLNYVNPKLNFDTIRATDDEGTTADAIVQICDPIGLFCEIIQKEMNLSEDQVYFYNQKINIPTDQRIYIAVGVEFVKTFGNVNRFNPTSGLTEEQMVNAVVNLKVNVLGRTVEALYRKEEVVMALKSVYAEQQMNANAFGLGRLSNNFISLSEIDGSAIPYRFHIGIKLQYATTKAKAVPYFDTFVDPEIVTEP